MVSTVFFDLDDTLLWDEKSVQVAIQNTCNLAEEQTGIDSVLLVDQVKETARDLYTTYDTYSFTKQIGINPFEALWGDFYDEGEGFERLSEIAPTYRQRVWEEALMELGAEDPLLGKELANTFPCERQNNPFVFHDTFKVLDRLYADYQLVLVTNGSPQLQRKKLDLTPKLKKYFDHIVISGEVGKGKPDPALFTHALEQSSVSKEDVIMVGDNLHTDILGAKRVGMKSVWVNRKNKEKQLVEPCYEVKELRGLLEVLEKV